MNTRNELSQRLQADYPSMTDTHHLVGAERSPQDCMRISQQMDVLLREARRQGHEQLLWSLSEQADRALYCELLPYMLPGSGTMTKYGGAEIAKMRSDVEHGLWVLLRDLETPWAIGATMDGMIRLPRTSV